MRFVSGRDQLVISEENKPLTEAEQAAYDNWLKQKVEAARNDPRPSIPHEEVLDDLNKLPEALAAKKSEPKDDA